VHGADTIKQANVLNDYLRKNALKGVEFKRDNYLLVVTYKELYLGNGADFYHAVAKEAIDEITQNLDATAVIPLENMYFITLEEFDLLCTVINSTDFSMEQVLEHAKANDREPESMKFDFTQHINSLGVDVTRPDYLDESIAQLTDVLPE
ncbi:hypothetical protein AB4589_13575, partial [Vibrio sp. 10N.222.49.A3]|uniref:hypothetical protein n=1 Tax=Vibrio sp. 10N.222.49.A3 TaxID=3229611 RepID=UPI0035529256